MLTSKFYTNEKMFGESDFELEDDDLGVIFGNLSNVSKHTTITKRSTQEDTEPNRTGKRTKTDPFLEISNITEEQDSALIFFESSPKPNCKQVSKIEANSSVLTVQNSGESPTLNYHPSPSNVHFNRNVKKKIVPRKFPGPAGLLPEQVGKHFHIKENEEEMIVSQICDERVFNSEAWDCMVKDFSAEKIDKQFLHEKYSIEWIKDKAAKQKLINQKAPFLACCINNVECSKKINSTVVVTLKDRTGEIQGTIVNDLYEKYDSELVIGSFIILKQFGVISTSTAAMITITEKNLVRIYRENNISNEFVKNSENVNVTNVIPLSVSDITRNIKEIREYNKSTKSVDEHLTILDDFNKNFERKESNLSNSFSPQITVSESSVLNNHNSLKTPNTKNFLSKSFSVAPNISICSNIVQNGPNVNNQKQKFNFKQTKTVGTNQKHKTNLDKINCTQISVETENVQEKRIVENMLEGLDADSFFNDF